MYMYICICICFLGCSLPKREADSDWSNVGSVTSGHSDGEDAHHGDTVSREEGAREGVEVKLRCALVQVIEPVLTIAAALSVQSPFSRVPLGHSDINVGFPRSYMYNRLVCFCTNN